MIMSNCFFIVAAVGAHWALVRCVVPGHSVPGDSGPHSPAEPSGSAPGSGGFVRQIARRICGAFVAHGTAAVAPAHGRVVALPRAKAKSAGGRTEVGGHEVGQVHGTGADALPGNVRCTFGWLFGRNGKINNGFDCEFLQKIFVKDPSQRANLEEILYILMRGKKLRKSSKIVME